MSEAGPGRLGRTRPAPRRRAGSPEEGIALGSVIAFGFAMGLQWFWRRQHPSLRPPHELVYDFVTLSGFAGLLTYAARGWARRSTRSLSLGSTREVLAF